MTRTKVKNLVAEFDGDEMTRIIRRETRERLILFYMDADSKYFDLGIENRDVIDDRVTVDAANATKEYEMGVKCATITPDKSRVKELGLRHMWKNLDGTTRNVLGGVISRKPVIVQNAPRLAPGWSKLVVMTRRAFGDQYKTTDLKVPGAGMAMTSWTPDDDGEPIRHELIHMPEGRGVALGIYSSNDSIRDFARACFTYGLDRGYPVYLSTKNTILKAYDGQFRNIFAAVLDGELCERFAAVGLSYEHRLIDDMVASSPKWEGGYIWVCKNYDGDVQSDTVAQGFDSLGLMTLALMTPDGCTVEAEAAHGTVTRRFRTWQRGEKTSVNPIASIHVWTRGLVHHGKLDNTPEVVEFANTLEDVIVKAVEGGQVTKDLALLVGHGTSWLTTDEFTSVLDHNLRVCL